MMVKGESSPFMALIQVSELFEFAQIIPDPWLPLHNLSTLQGQKFEDAEEVG